MAPKANGVSVGDRLGDFDGLDGAKEGLKLESLAPQPGVPYDTQLF